MLSERDHVRVNGQGVWYEACLFRCRTQVPGMFAVDTETVDEIRRAWEKGGELSAIIEFRRHFPLIADHARARLCVHAILSWTRGSPSPDDKTGQKGNR